MWGIRGVPNPLMGGEKEKITIPNGPGKEVTHIIQRRQQDVHEQQINGDDVQILERMVDGRRIH